jgi:hypothetical protein
MWIGGKGLKMMISWKGTASPCFIARKKEGTKLSSYKRYSSVKYTTTLSSQRLSRRYCTQQNRFSSTEVRYLQKHILTLSDSLKEELEETH